MASSRCIIPKYVCFHLQLSKSVLENIAYTDDPDELVAVLANKPVRFRVTIDGAAPGQNHGTDVDAEGMGVVTDQRLYQLVRQSGVITDHTFEIEFLDPGAEAYAFTFG